MEQTDTDLDASVTSDCALLARRLDFVVTEAENGSKNFLGVLAQERRAPDLCR